MGLNIITVPKLLQQWSEFVANHPQGNIFQTPELYELYKRTKNYEPMVVGVADDSDQILALMLGVNIREGKGLVGKFSSRSIIWGAPLYNNLQAIDLLMKAYDEVARKKVLFTQLRNLWVINDVLKSKLESLRYVYEDHLNFLIDLTQSPDTIWSKFSQSKRRAVRKAERAELKFVEEKTKDFIPVFYEILRETYTQAKMPFADISLFRHAYELLHPKNMVRFFAVKYKDDPVAGIAVLAYHGIIYEWYVGSLKSKEILKLYPNEYLIWNVLKWGCEHKYKLFDFLGAGKPGKEYGVREFKRGFGGELVNLGRFEKVYHPAQLKISKKMFELYRELRLS